MNRGPCCLICSSLILALIATLAAVLPGDGRATGESTDRQVAALHNLPEATAAEINHQPIPVSAREARPAGKVFRFVFPLCGLDAPVERMTPELAICGHGAPLSYWRDICVQI